MAAIDTTYAAAAACIAAAHGRTPNQAAAYHWLQGCQQVRLADAWLVGRHACCNAGTPQQGSLGSASTTSGVSKDSLHASVTAETAPAAAAAAVPSLALEDGHTKSQVSWTKLAILCGRPLVQALGYPEYLRPALC